MRPGPGFGRARGVRYRKGVTEGDPFGACGRSAVGSASPCQGEGRGFESRRPLERRVSLAVEWPRGEATACKAVYTGSNPVSTSLLQYEVADGRLAQGLARFLDTEEVTGSIPVSPTTVEVSRCPRRTSRDFFVMGADAVRWPALRRIWLAQPLFTTSIGACGPHTLRW